MPRVDAVVSCPVHCSFRVEQLAGMFDVPLSERCREQFTVEVPDESSQWSIGVIVGPSGSGKTTIARQAFGERLDRPQAWPQNKAVIDCFGQRPLGEITSLLTTVGFSSPPSWIKPYEVLSGGERFRCDLARALAGEAPGAQSETPLVVFDEFTSVVDRTVARIGSAAVAKAIRGGRLRRRFVAVTCHYDVLEWLEPDWVVDMATRTLNRRRLRRPQIRLDVFRCRHALWSMFARHHYLSGSLSRAAQCYAATWCGVPVAFCAVVSLIARKRRWRISRIVTLPDYQGVGIGMRLAEAVAGLYRARGDRVNVTASHPALIAHCRRSPRWRAVNVRKLGAAARALIPNYRSSTGRIVVSFEFAG